MRSLAVALGWDSRRAAALCASVALVAASVEGGLAKDALRRVEVQPGQTVRDLARDHLGSPDLWPEILASNELGAASDVQVGMKIVVPGLPIAEARAALAESLASIQEATAQGGSVFASELLGDAAVLRDQALREGQAGRWNEALETAKEAARLGAEARDLTGELRRQSGQALLAASRGQVQGRRTAALTWTERPRDSVLVENERVRTLSDSFAELRFSDESQIRLGANAQAVIQSMQVDRLNDRRRTTVSLVQGDAFALLGGGGRRDFEFQIESVDATIDSKNFWVRRDGDEAQFANYEDRPVQVSSGATAVTLGWNQGTFVSPEDGPTPARDLLLPPARAGPIEDSVHYRETIFLQWEPVEGAEKYAVEVDRDARFSAPVVARSDLVDVSYPVSGLGRGAYFWRVRAIDDVGFPGAPSGAGRFTVEAKGRKPYLLVTSPRRDGPTGDRSLAVEGQTEPNAKLSIDGRDVAVGADGTFQVRRRLAAGANRVRVHAKSPAGLTTAVSRDVEYLPGWFAPIDYDAAVARLSPKHFVTRGEVLTLSGTTAPDAMVEVVADDGRTLVSTLSRESGRFQVAVPLEPGESDLRTRVTTGAGFATEEHVRATRDPVAPRLHLPTSVPRLTRESTVTLAGRVERGADLLVNDSPVPVQGGVFSVSLPLESGRNQVRVVAVDPAGNRTERVLWIERDVGAPLVEETEWLRDATGRVFGIRVVVADPAGLRRVAQFGWIDGTKTRDGPLRLESDGRTYVGLLPGAGREAEDVRLVFVEVEDRLGNRSRHGF